MTESTPTLEKFKQEQKISLKGIELFQDNGYSSSAIAEYYEGQGAIPYIPDSITTKEIHGKSKDISRFHSDNFKLDFKKNQTICPVGYRMDYARKQINSKKNLDCWTNVYRCYKCKDCRFQQECVGKSKTHRHKEVYINPLMRRIRLRFKTKIGLEKYNKRFHKGEVAQAHILHNLEYREFKMRSKKSCQNEVNLFSIAYNLKKIQNNLKKNSINLKEFIKKGFVMFDSNYLFGL